VVCRTAKRVAQTPVCTNAVGRAAKAAAQRSVVFVNAKRAVCLFYQPGAFGEGRQSAGKWRRGMREERETNAKEAGRAFVAQPPRPMRSGTASGGALQYSIPTPARM